MVAIVVPCKQLEELVIEQPPRITIAAAEVKLELARYDPCFADDTRPPTYHVGVLLLHSDDPHSSDMYTLFKSTSEATARAAYETAATQFREGYEVKITGKNAAELFKPDQ